MRLYYRDGLLAVGSLAAVVAVGVLTSGAGAFGRPLAVGSGIAGAVALEAVFLRYSSVLLTVWERPGVALAGVVALGWVALWAVWSAPWALGAIAWGLVTYLVLLGCVLAGLGNPVAALVSTGRERE